MNPTFKISLLLAVLLFFTNCKNPNEGHLGEWKGADDHGTIGSIILDKNNNITMTMYDSESEANEYGLQQKSVLEGHYEINYSKSPIWLDIIGIDKNSKNMNKRLKCIIEFINDNQMKFRINFSDTARFETFDENDGTNTIILNKVR